jgi:hypothetical protein
MKRLIIGVAFALVLIVFLGQGMAYSQATFKIPFKFEAAGKSFPPGDYMVTQKDEGKITFRKGATGEEFLIPFTEKLVQPKQPIEEPQLIFDMVANFEPSYTEYITEYLLAEVWLTGKDGFLVLTAERSEYQKTVKGVKAEK